MRKLKSIIALAVILILLVVAYVYVSHHPKKSDTGSTPASTTVDLWKLDSTKINKLDFNIKGTEFIINKSGSEWAIPNYNFKLDQSYVGGIISSFTNVVAKEQVEKNPSDLDKYGLKAPKTNIKVTLSDNTEKTIFVGEKSPDGSTYYAYVNGDKAVYLIDGTLIDGISIKNADYRDKTIAAIDKASISYIKIAQPSQKAIELSGGPQTWMLNNYYNYPMSVDSQKIDALLTAASTIKPEAIEADNPKDLKAYGLDVPSLVLNIKDSKNTLNASFGKVNADGNVYFMLGNSSIIYTIAKNLVDNFNIKPFDIVQKFVALVNIADVDTITIKGNSENYLIGLTRVTTKAAKAGDADTVVTTYKVNDAKIEEEKFKTFYQELIGLMADSENDKKIDDKPELTITYNLNKGDEKAIKLDFVSYNDQMYVVFRNGIADFVIAKDKVSKVLSDIKVLK